MTRAGVVRACAWLLVLGCTHEVLAASVSLSGVVSEEATGSRVPGLTIRLTPREGSQTRILITVTDEKGDFRFAGVAADRYLFEVLQGTTVIHREVIELLQDTHKAVVLRRRGD